MKKRENKIIAKVFILSFLLIISFSIVQSAFAQALVPCGIGAGKADCTLCHLVIGFKNIYDYLLKVVLLPATGLVIVVAGVMYMVSSGNKGMIDKAKSALVYALTAMILALTAWLLINATLTALGYKKAGSWSSFSCDTTQSKGPTGGTGGGTLPGGGTGTGTGTGTGSPGTGQVSSGNATLDQVAQNLKDNTVYRKERGGWIDGTFYADCSSFAQEFEKQAYGWDPGGSTKEMLRGAELNPDTSTLKPGDLLIVNGSSGPSGHAVIYMGGDTVIGNSGVGRDVVYGNLSGYNVYAVRRAPG